MTVGSLIYNHNKTHPLSNYFSLETLKFFGERISEMRVLKRKTCISDSTGKLHYCYVLSSLQRNSPNSNKRKYTYIDESTYDIITID